MANNQEKAAKETARLLQESQKTGQALGLTFEDIANIQEQILQGAIKTQAALNAQLATTKETVKQEREFKNLQDSINSSMEDFVDLQGDFTNSLKAAAKLDKAKLKMLNDNVSALEDAVKAAKENNKFSADEIDDLESQLALRKQQIIEAQKLRDTIGETTLDQLESSISSISEGIKGMIPEPLHEMMGLDNLEDKLFGVAEKFPAKMVVGLTAVAGGLLAAYSILESYNAEVQATADATGLTFNESEKLVDSSYELAASGNMIAANQKDILASSEALVKEFGSTEVLAGDTAAKMADLTAVMGYSVQNAAQLQSVLMQAGGASADTALGIQQAGASLAEAYGVPFDDVVQDIAGSSEEVAKYFAGLPRDAVKTAVQLKAMGLSLKQAGKMADHLLDIEASLKAETKAQIMLNKDINLDNARQLAAQGKIAEAAAAATKEIGSAAEFAKMDQFQKKAAAEAAGLTVDELMKTYQMQEKMVGASKEQRDLVEKYGDKLGDISELNKDELADRASSLKNQDEMAAAMDNMKTALMTGILPVVKLIAPIFGVIANIIDYGITKPITFLVGLFEQMFNWVSKNLDVLGVFAATMLLIVGYQQRQLVQEGLIFAIQQSKLGLAYALNAASVVYNTLQGIATAIATEGLLPYIARMAMAAYASIVSIPIVGPFLAPAAAAAAAAIGYSYMTADDAVIPPAGEGGPGYSRVLSGPEGSIALNDKDSIIAGTDLGGGEGGAAPSGGGMDIGPLVAAIQQTNALLSQMASSPPPVLIGDEALRKIGRNVKVQNSRGS
jgi:hypothetical protein